VGRPVSPTHVELWYGRRGASECECLVKRDDSSPEQCSRWCSWGSSARRLGRSLTATTRSG
jgi:hypothetical protein